MGVPRDSLSHNHCVERLPLCLALVGQSLSDFIATIKGLCWFRLLGSTWHYKAARGTLFRNFPQDHKVASSEIIAVSQALWWETDLSPILLHYTSSCLPLVVRAHGISRAAKTDLCFAVALISRYSPPRVHLAILRYHLGNPGSRVTCVVSAPEFPPRRL